MASALLTVIVHGRTNNMAVAEGLHMSSERIRYSVLQHRYRYNAPAILCRCEFEEICRVTFFPCRILQSAFFLNPKKKSP
jgi:hypothetical protein